MAENIIAAGADNRPPMLKKSQYNSCQSRMKLYQRPHCKEKILEECDIRATNIVLQGLPPDVYILMNHHTEAKEIWDRIKLLIEVKGGSIHSYYLRFAQLINDMNTIRMTMQKLQVNTKFVNNLQLEWSKFVTDVKLARDMHESNFDQLYVYLRRHEDHANELSPVAQQYYSPPLPQLFYEALVPYQPYHALVIHLPLVVPQQAYQAPTVPQQLQVMFPQLDSGLAVPSFLPGDDSIYSLNKEMNVLGRQNLGSPSTSAILMAKLSAYDFDILSEYFEQPPFSTNLDIDITSDSNIISYEQYLNETETADAQDATYTAQQDAMIMSVIEEMSNQVAQFKRHDALSVIDTLETLKLAEESNLKIHAKQNDPIAKEKKVNIVPIDYAALNKLSEHFVKHFMPQKQLSAKQAF
ncbi:hypothetical protein Tco_1236784 [Tanacetum coccineum]